MMAVRRRFVARLSTTASLLGLLCASAASAQVPTEASPKTGAPTSGQPSVATTTPTASHPDLGTDPALGTFIDGVMKAHMEELHIPAAIVAVVKDGKVLYTKGYGHSDIAKGTPVDPATSLFRIGSISKLFTWTAVMQLVEQGKLSLDGDVNTYLKTFKIPDAYGKPITIRNLMTHTPGFEDGALGYLITSDSTAVKSIAETLKEHMPARVRPPGVLASYSNYGAALAGLIVEQVSGVPFNEYVQRNILEPLGMHYATFQEPLPADLKPYMVTGYAVENGVQVAKPFEFIGGFRPAGSFSVSAADMTHFMMAHLQNGQYNGAQILKPETAQLMHSRAFANDPRLPGMALGFYEQNMNGLRIIAHGGDTELFHSDMFLVPEKNVGIFVSYDGIGGATARDGLMRAFFDRYFPAPPTTLPAPPANFAQTAQQYTGAYRFARHNSSDIDKAMMVASPSIKVSVLPKDNRLMVTGIGATPAQFAPLGDGLFQQIDGHTRIGFRTDTAAGNVTLLEIGALPFMGTERVPWSENPSLWQILMGISALLLLTVLLSRYYRRKEIKAMPTSEKRAIRLEVATAVWFFLTIIAIVAVLTANMSTLASGIPTSLKVVLVMPVIFVILTVLLVIAAIQAWRRGYWGTARRVHFTLAMLASVVVTLFFINWNILGWQFG